MALTDSDLGLPWVDEYGTAHRRSSSVALSRPEAMILRELLRHEGGTVPQTRLVQLLEAAGVSGGARLLDELISRLQATLGRLSIVVRAALPHGFAVEIVPMRRAAD